MMRDEELDIFLLWDLINKTIQLGHDAKILTCEVILHTIQPSCRLVRIG